MELAQLQDEEVGDGTTSVVILAAELLKVCNFNCFFFFEEHSVVVIIPCRMQTNWLNRKYIPLRLYPVIVWLAKRLVNTFPNI